MHSQGREYHWITIQAEGHGFLATLFESLGTRELKVWIDADTAEHDFTRTRCGGLVTALAEYDGNPVAIAWSDFRVNAASYGCANSHRFSAFLRQLEQGHQGKVPLIYVVNSAGLSLMEGRTVFADAFALWPGLLHYAERNLVLTCAVGKCLGLAPVLFGLGHYRVAVAEQTTLNLTGPEVITLFFGKGINFAESAAAERFHDQTDLIHELVPSLEAAFVRFKGILSCPGVGSPARGSAPANRTTALLASVLDATPQELIPGWCAELRVFLGTRHGMRVGIFINPLERANNMITVRTLEKYAAGLDLFRALHVPVVSFLDSPGIDPRFEQSDANNFRKMLWVGEKIIHYPHGTMGVLTSRCFGGAATLSFPKVFGGERAVALRGCRCGTMDENIIRRLLSGSPRLLTQWQQVASAQGRDLEDLRAQGSIDMVVDAATLPAEIDRFLAERAAAPREPHTLEPVAAAVRVRVRRPAMTRAPLERAV